ncbi:trimeric intracellular cation channel family protein [Rathayibacter soli]|uniref:trimeric intracellular cation channel family protein n=1 Tax=Rathayibacter soli TaxID=3144168 RepID=UPI0027E4BFC3|nr:TRIC cation channel family protein [Glaciibacter superstes]
MTSVTALRTSIAARSYLVADLTATALFGFEGAAAGARSGLDLLGILVVGFSTALVGGIIRDVLLGDVPPAALRSPSRIVAAFAGSLVAFIVFALVPDVPSWLLTVPDAAALALFAVTGAEKAWAHGSNLWVVVALGTITGVGGGVVRDMLLNRLPTVLTGNVYATAAIAGSLVVGVALRFKVPPTAAMTAGFVVCFGIRLLAVAFDLQLPTLR